MRRGLLPGIGIALPHRGPGESLPSARTLLRAGLEVGDGHRAGGLRVQLTRAAFPGRIRDLRAGTALAILLPL